MLSLLFCGIVLAGAASAPSVSAKTNDLAAVKRWCILLGYDPSRAVVEDRDLLRFGMVILDPDSHPPIERVKDRIILIAYVSLGEAAEYRAFWPRIKDRPWVLEENPRWKGARSVDMRSDEWQRLIIDEVIPGIVAQGFRGIMMDTLDTASMLEERSPKDFEGCRAAMVRLVRAIHEKHPSLLLLSNNGFSILEEIAPIISGIVVEDITTMIDFKDGGYRDVPEEERSAKLEVIRRVEEAHALPVFAIDYASQKDRSSVKRCVRELKNLRFKPYVAEKDLDRIYVN